MRAMRGDIPIDELAGFLERPITAVLATFRRDGRVLLSPVWHEWRDGGFNIGADRSNGHVANIRRDPRVSLVVPGQEPPWTGVEIRCEARILEEDVDEVVRRIAVRYEGSERAADDGPSTSVVLRLEPGELRTWDYSDEEG
jgi:PPOX class probable F420-dependent enzyme